MERQSEASHGRSLSTDFTIQNENFNLRARQIERINKMLSLSDSKTDFSISNNTHELSHVLEEPWKILIYDNYCQSLLSPILKLGDLRKQGITLHLLLHSERKPIPDVPALYFCLPTKDNIDRICQDCKNRTYESIYLNFASTIDETLLSELATKALETDSVNLISKVYDQYIDFITLEPTLFSLHQPNSYLSFHDPTLSDSAAQSLLNRIVTQLFSVCVVTKTIPVIRSSKTGVTKMIAEELAQMLRNYSEKGILEVDVLQNRPVLILLDRDIDLPVMISHTWTYQALAHDLLDISLNKAKIHDTETNATSEYDFDSANDPFLQQNKGAPFHSIALQVKNYISEYKNSVEEFNKLSGGEVDLDQLDENSILGKTKNIGAFVTTIPQIQKKKRIIDLHTNIATSLLNDIKNRKIDTFFDLEMNILKGSPNRGEIFNVLEDQSKGTPQDKVRLFLIYFLSNEKIDPNETERALNALKAIGQDLTEVVDYLKRAKAYTSVVTPSTGTSGGSGFVEKFFSGNINPFDKQLGFGSDIGNQLSDLFSSTVKSLSGANKEQLVTTITASIMEMKNDPRTKDFLYFDPKVKDNNKQIRYNNTFKEAIVFIVGGGNHVEYQNLQEFAQKNNKTVVYGSTDLPNPQSFIQQLAELSKKGK